MYADADAMPQRLPVSAFREGMVVDHPQYGSGVIVSLSGVATARTATVRFYGTAREKRFRLAQSPLVPVQSDQ
jgi:DNA helicase-2/ATP-dependent DNA helicase PcrA